MEKNVMYEFDVVAAMESSTPEATKPIESGVIQVKLDTGVFTIQIVDGEILISKDDFTARNRLQICPVVANCITIK